MKAFFARGLPRRARIALPAGMGALLLLNACGTVTRLAPFDLSVPGWTLREGQAVWRHRYDAPEMTGELLVATRADGATFVQLTKNPLPVLTAETMTNRWEIQFIPQNRTYAGTGQAPRNIVWLHLARRLTGSSTPLSGEWKFQRTTGGAWNLTNTRTGEFVEGFLTPGLPICHTVKSHETLGMIADNYGVSVVDLCTANPRLDPDRLRPGQTVNIPIP